MTNSAQPNVFMLGKSAIGERVPVKGSYIDDVAARNVVCKFYRSFPA